MRNIIIAAIVGIVGVVSASTVAHAQMGGMGAMGGVNRNMLSGLSQSKPKPKVIKTTGTKGRGEPGAARTRLSDTFAKVGTSLEQKAGAQEKAAIRLQKQADREAAKGYTMSSQALKDQAALKMQKANADMAKGKALVDYSMKMYAKPATSPKPTSAPVPQALKVPVNARR